MEPLTDVLRLTVDGLAVTPIPAHWPLDTTLGLEADSQKVHTTFKPVSRHARKVLGDDEPRLRSQKEPADLLVDLPHGVHAVWRDNLRRTLFATSKASFWPAFRKFTCDKPRPIPVGTAY